MSRNPSAGLGFGVGLGVETPSQVWVQGRVGSTNPFSRFMFSVWCLNPKKDLGSGVEMPNWILDMKLRFGVSILMGVQRMG